MIQFVRQDVRYMISAKYPAATQSKVYVEFISMI